MKYKYFGSFRLLLAIMVVVQHYVANDAPMGDLYHRVIPLEVGSLAVLVFFALSGFVISEAVDRLYWNKPVSYLANRLLRIVPHFLLAVMVSIGIFYLCFHLGTLRVGRGQDFPQSFGVTAFSLRNLALNLIGFMPGVNHVESFDFIDIAWAVRVEMVFYLSVFLGLLAIRLPIIQRIGLVKLAVAGYVAVLPLLVLAAIGYAPEKLGLASYFAFGSALYFATTRRRHAALFAVACLPLIALHFLSQATYHVEPYYPRDWITQFLMLVLLLGLMTCLAFASFTRLRRLDRKLGDLTYPLYLYHAPVMVAIVSLTIGYSYGVFALSILLALAFSALMARAVDPIINRLRDAVRGQRVDESGTVQYDSRSPVSWSQT